MTVPSGENCHTFASWLNAIVPTVMTFPSAPTSTVEIACGARNRPCLVASGTRDFGEEGAIRTSLIVSSPNAFQLQSNPTANTWRKLVFVSDRQTASCSRPRRVLFGFIHGHLNGV